MTYILMFCSMYRAIQLPMVHIKIGLIPFLFGCVYFFYFNKKGVFKILFFQALLFSIYLLSIIVSLPQNYLGTKIFIYDIVILFQAIAIVYLSRNKEVEYIFDIFINIVLFQCVVALIFYIYPKLGIKINEIFVINTGIIEGIKQIQGRRLFGIGTLYFGAGIYNIISILLCMHNFLQFEKKRYLIKILFILVIGNFFSRATLLAIPLLIIYLSMYKYRKIKKILLNRQLICIMILTILIGQLIDYSKLEKILSWGLEIIYVIFDNKESDSLNILISFFKIVPDTLKTLLIGDAMWEINDGFYYKGVDIGYLRLVYLYGIIGLIANFIIVFIVMFSSLKGNQKKLKKLMMMLFLTNLLLNIKGYTNINLLIFILYIRSFYFKNQRSMLY